VIPEKKDSAAARKRKGYACGRPPALDVQTYKRRNVVERSFALTKQWRGLATRCHVEHHLLRPTHHLAAGGAPGQLLVAVEVTGISYTETSTHRGGCFGQPQSPFVPVRPLM
jgi:hypothetical protein